MFPFCLKLTRTRAAADAPRYFHEEGRVVTRSQHLIVDRRLRTREEFPGASKTNTAATRPSSADEVAGLWSVPVTERASPLRSVRSATNSSEAFGCAPAASGTARTRVHSDPMPPLPALRSPRRQLP